MKLRNYQRDCMDAVLASYEEVASSLIVLPTGTGKTIIFAHIANEMREHGRVMVMAHRDELIQQAHEKIWAVTGIEPDIEKAEYWADKDLFNQSPIVVSSVQTLNAGQGGHGRMVRFHPDQFSLLVIDEAHHAVSASYRRVIAHFQQNPDLKILGVTATPDRTDEEALGQIFKVCSFDYEIIDAINDGWLVGIEQQYVEIEGLDFSKCKTTAGDLNQGDLADVMEVEKVIHGVVGPLIEIAGDRKTLMFSPSVAHAERACEIINRHRPGKACFVCGTTPKDRRREILRDYHDGVFQYLVNVGIATEGFDEPGIEVIAMARPTKSRCLYAQMCGRGTRPAEEIVPFINDCESPEARRQIIMGSDKRSMLVIDFVGNSGRHKLMSAADILGGRESDEVVARAKEAIEKSGGAGDVQQVTEEVKQTMIEEARRLEDEGRRKRSLVRANVRWTGRDVNPFNVFDLSPVRARQWKIARQATARQKEVLAKRGIDNVERLTFAEAHQLMDEVIRRFKQNRANFKQVKILQKYGEDPNCSFDDAITKIDGIKRNGWRSLK